MRFARYAWVVLALNIPVILWGAFVRVSYSGDGCGAHWPFCNGQAIPRGMTRPTFIEFTHRMMTSADTMLLVGLLASAFWIYPKRHAVRRYAVASMAFLLVEALLGAGLVLLRMVARDQSAGRIWYLSAHLTNTMLLLAALTLTAWLATSKKGRLPLRQTPRGLLWSALITVVISISGAVAALGDMLFPAGSLMEGMRQDLAAASPLLLRLRMTHPVIALVGAGFIVWTALDILRRTQSRGQQRAAILLTALIVFQLFWGAANLTLLAPVWMQLTHLLLADLVWIAMVLLIAESITAVDNGRVKEPETAFAHSGSEAAARNPA